MTEILVFVCLSQPTIREVDSEHCSPIAINSLSFLGQTGQLIVSFSQHYRGTILCFSGDKCVPHSFNPVYTGANPIGRPWDQRELLHRNEPSALRLLLNQLPICIYIHTYTYTHGWPINPPSGVLYSSFSYSEKIYPCAFPSWCKESFLKPVLPSSPRRRRSQSNVRTCTVSLSEY